MFTISSTNYFIPGCILLNFIGTTRFGGHITENGRQIGEPLHKIVPVGYPIGFEFMKEL